MKLEGVTLRGVSQTPDENCYPFPLTQSGQDSQTHRGRKQDGVASHEGAGNGEFVFHGCRVSAGEAEDVPGMGGGDGRTTAGLCLTPLNCALKND